MGSLRSSWAGPRWMITSGSYVSAQPLNCVRLFVTPWTVTSRQEYWSRLPFPPPWDSPNPGIRLTSPALAGGSLSRCHLGSPASGPLGNKQWAPRGGEGGGGGGRAI